MNPIVSCWGLLALLSISSCSPEEKQKEEKKERSPAKETPPLLDLAKELVETITTKDKQGYYGLFPNATQVATYGILTYGLSGSLEERPLWIRPWPEYSKSIDSLEQLEKPRTFKMIEQYLNMLSSQTDGNKIALVKIDTINSRTGEIRNVHKKIKVATLSTDLVIHLAFNAQRYQLVCPNVIYIENEGWFLRLKYSEPRIEKEN